MARRIPVSAALTALGLALSLAALPGRAGAADKLVLQLHREAQFEFAGYYAALWQGFYRDAGIEVEIKPGTPPGAVPIDPVREVTEGRARFATGTAQLLIRTAQGLPLLLLAPIFQRSGAAVYYRADGDLSSPGALINGRIGRLPVSNILDLEFRTALYGEAIDPDKLKSLSLEPDQVIAALANHQIDAVAGSAWELPWQARERGIALKSFDPADYRTEFYGDSLFTLQRFADADPATVQRFREASIKGWEYALQHPDQIAARILAELPVQVPVADPAGFARYQSEVARRLARYPDAPLGHSNPERWKRIERSLIEVGVIARPVDLEAFLHDPDAGASRSAGWLAALIVAGAAALFAAAALFWHRQFRVAAKGALERLRGIRHRHPVPGPTDLDAMLTALERSIRKSLPGSVKFRLSLVPEPRLCHADRDAVRAATLDLAAAAAADMPAGGELVVGTRHHTIDEAASAELPGSIPGDFVRLTVRDNGPGLSPECLDVIFDPAATARPAVVAAEELTRRLGGFARVESAEGIGTAVHLYFRRAVASGESAQQSSEDDPQAEAAE